MSAGCDNYRPPLTCLTAPSSESARCDKCRARLSRRNEPVTRGMLADACRAVEAKVADATAHVEQGAPVGMARQLVRYAGKVQASGFGMLADAIEGED